MSLRNLDDARIALLQWCNRERQVPENAESVQALLGSLLVVALIEALNARILAGRSATAALQQWSTDHQLTRDPLIRARRLLGVTKPVSAEQRERLRIDAKEPVAYRRVELTCGDRVLCEADNWYVPSRLGATLNGILETTDEPFGRVVRHLGPKRENFSVEILWTPFSAESELEWQLGARPGKSLTIPWQLFRHRALMFRDRDHPLSEVTEVYTREILPSGGLLPASPDPASPERREGVG